MDQRAAVHTGSSSHALTKRTPLRVSVLYVVLALLWITVSDWALFRFFGEAADQETFSILKGAGFVLVTGLLLYFLLRSWVISRQFSVLEAAETLLDRPVRPRFMLTVFLVLSATILVTSSLVTSHLSGLVRKDALGSLDAAAELKAGEIERWLEERWGDASILRHDEGLAEHVNRWFAGGMDADRDAIEVQLRAMQSSINYRSIALFDTRGRLRMELGEALGANVHLRRLVGEALATRESRFSDLYRDDEHGGRVLLDFLVPVVLDHGGRTTVQGAVALRVDPNRYLYHLVRNWPFPTASGETLIVRRENDQVVFLNELRNRPGSTLSLRVPVDTPDLPAAQAVRGVRGPVEGADYRGVPVLAVVRPIAGTPWYMIAKVDRDEVLRPAGHVQMVSATITLAAIALAGLAVGFSWRQQMRNLALKQRVYAEERLALSKHFEYLSHNANDIIVLADERLHIVEINERAVEFTGFPRDQLLGRSLSVFRSVAAREGDDLALAQVRDAGNARYETQMHHRDGRDLPVEVTAARVEAEGRDYFQFVIRDISERRRHERQLVKARDFYTRVLNDFPNPIWRAAADGGRDYVNNAWIEFTGKTVEEERGEGWTEGVHPQDRPRCLEIYRTAFNARRAFQMDYRLRYHDGDYRWITDFGKPIVDDDGVFLGYVGSCYDVHERRLYEERLSTLAAELTEHKNRLETVLETTPDHVYLHDRAGRYLMVNNAGLEALGMSEESVLGRTWQQLGLSEALMRPFHQQREGVVAGKGAAKGQFRYETGRDPRDFAYTISPVVGADGNVVATVTTATDITERALAAERIERLSQMYATLSQCNEAIVRIRDRAELFHKICRIIVHYSHFRYAWISRLDAERNELVPIAFSGEACKYLADVPVLLDADQPGARYPTGRAALQQKHVISNDFLNDVDAGIWRDRALRTGVAAVASFPIREGGGIGYTLNVCAAERDYFTDELVALLDEMANDIGFALGSYRQADALRQSESTLRLFFDLPFIGMAVTSPADKRWVKVNRTLCEMLGYTFEELTELTWTDVSHPEDLAADVAQFERVMHREIDGYKMDKRFVRKDGGVVYASIDVKCIRDARGDVDFFVATVADITERRLAEEARRTEEDRYLRQRNALIGLSVSEALNSDDLDAAFRQITETDARTLGVARVSIWRFDFDRAAIRCVDLYELEADRHTVGAELYAVDYPAYFRALGERNLIAADDARGNSNTSEFDKGYLTPLGIGSMMDAPIHLGDGLVGVLCHEHVGPPRQWTADEKTFAIAIANFVSLTLEGWERKRNEEKLAAATAQFQGLVEQSIAGIFIIADGRYGYVNPRLAEILGYTPEELVDHEVVESIADSDRTMVQESLTRCLNGAEDSKLIAYLGKRRDGSVIDVGAHINRAVHAGRPAVIGVVQDISEKKRAEERIQEYIGRLEMGMLGTIKAVSVMSELRDPYTYGHEQRVGDLAAAMAVEMGLAPDVVKGLQIAGYVHDIGKIVVPAEILAKPTQLSQAEFELIKAHPQQGYEVLKEIDFPWPVAQVALQHHERLDGSGYPQGLKGEQIVFEARILAVADVVEAMAAHRPYRPARGIEAALDEVIRFSGVKYEPAAVDACVRLFRERGYDLGSMP